MHRRLLGLIVILLVAPAPERSTLTRFTKSTLAGERVASHVDRRLSALGARKEEGMRFSVAFPFVTALVVSLFVAHSSVRGADRPDAWITMSTKISLMTTDGVSTKNLNVDTVKGVVTLHGTVPSEGQKEKAGQVARGVDGVKEVKNLLQVVSSSQQEVVERSDDMIKDSVVKAFKANKRVSNSGIKVASVNKGVVLLSGTTKSLEAHLESVQVAAAVRGVRRVSTEVQVES
jgi:hyperosmotically inducible periplasmic protein